MKPGSIAVVGAAETTELGKIPNMSNIQLHADSALNALADCGLRPQDVDGIACCREEPTEMAHYLGITPKWVDGTAVGGTSFLIHLRHAAAAINEGLCSTVLITHGESGRSNIAKARPAVHPGSLNGQFEQPYGVMGPPTMFTIPLLRYLKEYNVPIEKIANVAVVQREWAAKNPRAMMRDPITVDDVLNARMIAWPFTILMCCLVTDGGGALVVTSAERAKDFPTKPVYILGTGESVESRMVSQLESYTSSRAFRVSSQKAFEESGVKHSEIDHLMIYDAFAHLPVWGLEDLGFCERGEAPDFIWERNTAPGGKLPLNTSGGGLSYTHTGMYGMFALQESIRQMRGTAPAQVPNAQIGFCQGVGGMFAAAGSIVFTNQEP